MPRFQEQLFTTFEGYLETPLRDRKQDLYELHSMDFRKTAEFVRDVIAMANTSRRYGAPAQILFGIDNDTNVIGLHDCLMPYHYNSQPLATVWEAVIRRVKDICHGQV